MGRRRATRAQRGSAVALAGVRDAQARDTERGAPRCEGWESGWCGVEWSGAGAERRGAERAAR